MIRFFSRISKALFSFTDRDYEEANDQKLQLIIIRRLSHVFEPTSDASASICSLFESTRRHSGRDIEEALRKHQSIRIMALNRLSHVFQPTSGIDHRYCYLFEPSQYLYWRLDFADIMTCLIYTIVVLSLLWCVRCFMYTIHRRNRIEEEADIKSETEPPDSISQVEESSSNSITCEPDPNEMVDDRFPFAFLLDMCDFVAECAKFCADSVSLYPSFNQ
jgi:hypothetical protein